jgi:hypothetical protein
MVSSKLNFPRFAGSGRFDQIVWLTAGGLLVLAGLIIWRGDTAGVPVRTTFPARNAEAVSAQTSIRITFGQVMNTAETPDIKLAPR